MDDYDGIVFPDLRTERRVRRCLLKLCLIFAAGLLLAVAAGALGWN